MFNLDNVNRALLFNYINANSNAPTLYKGERILSDTHYYLHNPPERGDVILFYSTREPKLLFTKRIFGLPGDKISIVNSELYLNDNKINRKKAQNTPESRQGSDIYVEALPNGVTYTVKYDRTLGGDVEGMKEIIIPAGMYFVLGDNRNNSLDSRYLMTFGLVPEENIKGKVMGILLSPKLNRIGRKIK